jgi:thiamine biosynthesis lipoprotein
MTMTATASDSVARAEWSALGMTVTIAVTDAALLAPAERSLAEDIAALDLACSRFRADSEISSIDTAEGRLVRVSPLLADALTAALEAARRTDGDVDPTVGSVICALGYDRDFVQLPPDGPIPAVHVRTVPGWKQIGFDPLRRIVRVPAGVRIDLGATAKAFAADRSATRLAAALGCGVLVSLGGDVAVAGAAPTGGWTVRVQDQPGRIDEQPTGPAATVSITAGGLATSSTAVRRWRRGGQWMHHLIDPRTGMPAVSPWRTVSVAAATCLEANTASTCAVIRGFGGLRWLRALGLPARLVANDGRVTTLGEWPTELPQ